MEEHNIPGAAAWRDEQEWQTTNNPATGVFKPGAHLPQKASPVRAKMCPKKNQRHDLELPPASLSFHAVMGDTLSSHCLRLHNCALKTGHPAVTQSLRLHTLIPAKI